MSRARLPLVAGVGAVILVAGGALVGGYAGTDAVRTHLDHSSAPSPPPTPAAYRQAGSTPTPVTAPATPAVPDPAVVSRTLAAVVTAPQLGHRLRAQVLDAATGTVLYNRDGTAPTAPASTAKLLTAAAVLSTHRATDRIRTTVVAGTGGAVVLVGGGDPTVTAAAAGHSGAYPDAARISDLAAQLIRAHLRPTRIVVDDSLFTGPPVSPAWAGEDVPSDYAAPITAAMVDGGRAAPGNSIRSTTPDLDAGRGLAAALGRHGIPVSRGPAPAGARVLATVSSAPIGTLVEQMLQQSDNVIAECLARLVARSQHRPASFAGGVAAVRAVLTPLGVDPGAGMVDASGLAASDRLSPAVLAGAVRLAAGTAHPTLHAVLAGMPVAAWSGTLADRYLSGTTRAGAGVVRAKTGTLTGVSTLAGTVHDRGGRLLAVAFMADRTGSTPAAEAALDRIATQLAGCGCG